MYEDFFGLRERPFDLTASPRFLFLTARHREALSNLQYGVSSQKGLTLIVGEAGTGKTTLLRAAIELQRGQNVTPVYVNNPTLSRGEFYELLGHEFGLGLNGAGSKTRFLIELERALRERQRAGTTSALLIDEAQSLPDELLEEVRLLSNLETSAAKLLPTVLIGQPELAERLNKPSLRQLKQRVALRCSLAPLDLRETAAYIAKRIRVAGGDGAAIFTREAIEQIHASSRGIPRTINVICDNALVSAFALDTPAVNQDIVIEVCRDFDLGLPPGSDERGALRIPETVSAEPAARKVEASVAPRTTRLELAREVEGSVTVQPNELFQAVTRRRRFLFF
jgi:general secretion pathway protein A